MRFEQKPLSELEKSLKIYQEGKAYMKIPNATHNWKEVTKPPRIDAGLISALKTGIVEILTPIPRIVVSFNSAVRLIGQFHTKSHEKSANQQAPPILGECLCQDWEDAAVIKVSCILVAAYMVTRTIVQSRRLYPDDRASCSADPLPMRYSLSVKSAHLKDRVHIYLRRPKRVGLKMLN